MIFPCLNTYHIKETLSLHIFMFTLNQNYDSKINSNIPKPYKDKC
ncbi:hypothetical protein ESCAB7627_0378 [Escherichia albertii TW07627]|uniref:Uncharacterized protein n=1 Tax=Escherichia albertii (strain TW07627) TaxID=502347 RepID=A0ABC9NP90_ESCAT|nr:hypothetical protein ESCAB7627_0378 [Escherichia albertii TW07627]